MKAFTLSLSDPQAVLETVGGKGMSLARLAREGLPVPDGFHITTAAYRQFVAANQLQPEIFKALEAADAANPAALESASQAIQACFAGSAIPAEIAQAVRSAYQAMGAGDASVAVRSSATAEDLPGASFAGQQETYLNIQGTEGVLEAVRKCWASLWTARAIAYRIRQGIPPDNVALAVVVQSLVPAEAAGILFTANPVTGSRDELLINAAWGLGEAVVGGVVTPDSITVDKRTGRLLQRQIAQKLVMTVPAGSGTQEQPVPDQLKNRAVLTDAQAAALARHGMQIETLYGMPMDIEWALAGGKFAILQARPITALPEPQISAPVEWPVPDARGKYMRASIIDLMPDPISPLFASMAFKAYDAGLTHAMSDITRSRAVLPEHFLTINGYVYSDTRLNGRQAWWTLTRMLPAFPRMLRTGISYWRENGRAAYVETVRRWESRLPADLSPSDLLEGAHALAWAAMFNLTAQMVWMGACAGSEMLFTRVYNRMVRRSGDPEATAFLMGFNSLPIRAEKSLYDLAAWCRGCGGLAEYILAAPSDQLVATLENGQVPAGVTAVDWQAFCERFRSHLKQFGHIIYNLDFARPLPLDDPAPMFETLKMYLRGQGADPHERQGALAARRTQAVEDVLPRLKGLKRWAFRTSLRWAQTLAEAREDALGDIGLGYPVLRRILHELGSRLAAAEMIEQAGDIFWLREEELKQAAAALERGDTHPGLDALVRERRTFSQAAAKLSPPPVLPVSLKRVMGIKIEGMVASGEDSHTESTIKGAGTSPGQVTASACILHGPEDFSRMQPGCVLVAAITTPAWTPLFAMAAAVVTDIGGPLSHGSIVAREYGIPAVMGTGVATHRIRDGQTVTVDGSAGMVTLA